MVRRKEMVRRQTTESGTARSLGRGSPSDRWGDRHRKIDTSHQRGVPGQWKRDILFWKTAFRHRRNRYHASRPKDNFQAKSDGGKGPWAFVDESFRTRSLRIQDAIQKKHAQSPQPPRFETRKARTLYSRRSCRPGLR